MRKIALVVGHNALQKGAYSNVYKQSEYSYNSEVALKLKELFPDNIDVYFRQGNKGYQTQMKEMLQQLNSKVYYLTIELHLNSFNETSKGVCVICYPTNNKSKKLANKYIDMLCKQFNRVNRGLILPKSEKDRGAYGIYNSKSDYILVEPFFLSNPNEYITQSQYTQFMSEYIERVLNENLTY